MSACSIKLASIKFYSVYHILEGSNRSRTGDHGFADRCLTTWLHYQTYLRCHIKQQRS